MLRLVLVCSLVSGTTVAQDCNQNGLSDLVDIGQGHSDDCDANGIPDECQFGQVLLFEPFDGTGIVPSGVSYSFSSLWHVTSSCQAPGTASSGPHAYYGNDNSCTFALGANPGSFIIHDLALPPERLVTLQYWSYYEGEFGGVAGCGDIPTDYVSVIVIGEALVDDYCHDPSTPQGTWRTIDLTPWSGQTVSIAFSFLAGDGLFNDFYGWSVDHIRVTAKVDISGNGVPDLCERISQTYCDSNPNSTGHTAGLAALGSPAVVDEDLFLRTLHVPNNQTGYYLMSSAPGQVMLPPPSQGILCVGSPLIRLNTMGNVQNSGDLGEIRVRLDFQNLPQGTVILPGSTWHFQCWFRDGASSNTSRGVTVAFR